MIKIKYHSTDLSTTRVSINICCSTTKGNFVKLQTTQFFMLQLPGIKLWEHSFIHLSLCNHSQLQPQLVQFTLPWDNTWLSSQCTIRVQTSIQQLLLLKIIVLLWSLNLWLKGTQHLRCHNNGNTDSYKGQTEAKRDGSHG